MQQNTHLVSNFRLATTEVEWKLAIYLHQLLRLTLYLWQTTKENENYIADTRSG